MAPGAHDVTDDGPTEFGHPRQCGDPGVRLTKRIDEAHLHRFAVGGERCSVDVANGDDVVGVLSADQHRISVAAETQSGRRPVGRMITEPGERRPKQSRQRRLLARRQRLQQLALGVEVSADHLVDEFEP